MLLQQHSPSAEPQLGVFCGYFLLGIFDPNPASDGRGRTANPSACCFNIFLVRGSAVLDTSSNVFL